MELATLVGRLSAALRGGPPVVIAADRLGAPTELPEGTALAVPTSGSTGPPRWAALSAAAVTASARISAERLGGPGSWLLALPTTGIAGLNVVARALLAGTALETLPPGRFTPEAFARAAAALPPGPAFVSLVPTQLGRLLETGAVGIVRLGRFDAVLVGGGRLDANLRQRAEAAGARVVETYGMAETCGGCVYDGVPLAGVAARLSNGGLVLLGGPTLALGYAAGAPERFVEERGRRWFTSSDLGRWAADGRLEILGRADNAITTGGQTIAAEAVEAVLRELPGVGDALVVGLPDEVWGEAVTALITPAGPGAPPIDQLRAHVKARLGPAHAPRRWAVVAALAELGPGKPDRVQGRLLAARLTTDQAARRLL
ncbi:MAG: AMP-binding protein [Bifidobacteriaceae bacterium]|nr:AMP-binding protein [Bifidobacteriaceae bacterium]